MDETRSLLSRESQVSHGIDASIKKLSGREDTTSQEYFSKHIRLLVEYITLPPIELVTDILWYILP